MFDLSRELEHDAVAAVVADVAAALVDPAAREAEQLRAVPERVWKGLLELGLTTPVDGAYGGGGVPDPFSQLLAIEGLAHGDPGITAAATWSGNAALLIGECGTNAQRQSILPEFVTDSTRRGSVAMYEGFGRAPSEYATAISLDGDGWRIVGRKVAVPFGATAASIVVIGVDPSDGRLRAALVDRAAHGVGIVNDPSSGNIALDAAATATLDLDTVVGSEQIIGGPDANPELLSRASSRLRLAVAALALGCGTRARSYASAYASERIAFGKPIAALQGVSFMMADAEMQLDAARLEMWHAATMLADSPATELERAVSRAVNYSCAVACAVTRDAIQVLGGHGFIEDHPVERWYRAAAALSAVDFDPTCTPFAAAL